MILKEINDLISITENVIYDNPDLEFSRNLSGIIKLMPKPCCCNGGVSMVSMSAPSSLANNGAGLASYIANKMIYGSDEIPKPDIGPYS